MRRRLGGWRCVRVFTVRTALYDDVQATSLSGGAGMATLVPSL